MSLSYNYPPQYAYPSAPPVFRGFPAPPRLHWGVVFGLSVITLGIFGMIWMVVQANWVRKVTKNSKPFVWCLVYLLFLPFIAVVGGVAGFFSGVTNGGAPAQTVTALVGLVAQLGGLVLYIVAAYTLKGALEAEPINIPLGGIMTFFFAATYFQYHLFDYNVEGRVAEQLNAPTEAALANVPVPAVNMPEVPPQA